jgi:hypothetical protein
MGKEAQFYISGSGSQRRPTLDILFTVLSVAKRLQVLLIRSGRSFEGTKIAVCSRTTVLRTTDPRITLDTEFYAKYNNIWSSYQLFCYVP